VSIKSTKKLSLDVETIRVLDSSELAVVGGGAGGADGNSGGGPTAVASWSPTCAQTDPNPTRGQGGVFHGLWHAVFG
jgi:hypothetical protein